MTTQIKSKELVPGDFLFVKDLWVYEVNKVYSTFNVKNKENRNPIVVVEMRIEKNKSKTKMIGFDPEQTVEISKRK